VLLIPVSFALGALAALIVVKAASRLTPPVVSAEPTVRAPVVEEPRPPPRRPPASALVQLLPPEEADFAARARTDPGATLDPSFAAHMLPKLSRAALYLARVQHARLLELRCEARTCVARFQWPPEAQGPPARDLAVFAPEEPGCTVEVLPPRGQQQRTFAPLRVSFYYRCPDWVEQVIATQEPVQPAETPEAAEQEPAPATP
jgi:hypothetical protein